MTVGDGTQGRPRRNTRPRDRLGRPLAYGSLGEVGPPEGVVRDPAESLALAQELLDAGRPFHAHEVLEDAWKAAPEPERELWRGLAQLAVGATHAARGNRAGASALLARGRAAVAPFGPEGPHHLDLDGIDRWAGAALDRVGEQCPVDLPAPRLTRAGGPSVAGQLVDGEP